MSAELERLVALVTCANVHLQESETKFNLERTITEYCHGMEFVEEPIPGIAGSTKVIAPEVSKWFAHIKEQGAERVRLHYRPSAESNIPDHISVAFVGGGSNWLIEVQHGKSSCLFSNILDPRAAGLSHDWKTYFARLKDTSEPLEGNSLSVDDSRKIMDQLLVTLSNFAGRFDYSRHWADIFDRSRKVLNEFEPSESDEFIPKGIYSKEARQLLQAALSTWVFGGMGSWNDLAFNGDDGVQYASLSKQLYEAICKSMASVANSYP